MKRRTGIAITGEGTGRGTLKYWKPEWNREGLQQKCRELGFAVGGSREILLARLKDGGMELPDENEMRSTETSICLKQAAMKNSNDVVIEDNHAAGSIISEGVRRSARTMEGLPSQSSAMLITRDELAMPLEQDGSLSLGGADSPSSSRGVALPPRIVKSREPVMKYGIHRTSGIGYRYVQHADGYEEALEASLRVAYDRNSLEPVVLHFADGSSFRTCMTQAEYAAKYSGCQEYDTELLVHCKKE